MLTIRAKFDDGKITFIDPVPLSGQHDILITFLTSEHKVIGEMLDNIQELETVITRFNTTLTKKELDILPYVKEGLTNDEIAEVLNITSGTVRNYLSSIYAKLKARNRTEAVHKAMCLGLIP